MVEDERRLLQSPKPNYIPFIPSELYHDFYCTKYYRPSPCLSVRTWEARHQAKEVIVHLRLDRVVQF